VVALGREAHEVGVGRRLEAVLDDEVEARTRAQPAGPRGDDREVEDRVVVLGVVGLRPHLAQRSEAERLGLLLDDDGDLLDGAHAPSLHEWWQ
jgi:hypothetical protein